MPTILLSMYMLMHERTYEEVTQIIFIVFSGPRCTAVQTTLHSHQPVSGVSQTTSHDNPIFSEFPSQSTDIWTLVCLLKISCLEVIALSTMTDVLSHN